MEQAIAVRFYENKKYGSTQGKGLFRKALFNATADLQHPKTKYLLDMFTYSDWENTAKTDDDMKALGVAADYAEGLAKADLLGTWIKRLDSDGTKPRVCGFGLMDLNTHQLVLVINDTAIGVEEAWELEAKPCKQSTQNKNSPQLLATNVDLS
jgi:hypothetical protein